MLQNKVATVSYVLLIAIVHVFVGVYLGTTYHNQADNVLDQMLLEVIKYLYMLKNLG